MPMDVGWGGPGGRDHRPRLTGYGVGVQSGLFAIVWEARAFSIFGSLESGGLDGQCLAFDGLMGSVRIDGVEYRFRPTFNFFGSRVVISHLLPIVANPPDASRDIELQRIRKLRNCLQDSPHRKRCSMKCRYCYPRI